MKSENGITKKELSKFKHGLVAITRTPKDIKTGMATVVHFCGYPNPPTERDIKLLEEELNTDPEFNLIGRINKDVFIVDASPAMVKFYLEKADKRK